MQVVKNNLTKFPCELPLDFNVNEYQIYHGPLKRILHDGDCFDLGGCKLLVIHTPGHSPWHCYFYEIEKGYLYSGDLVYKGKLDIFCPSTNPQLFLQSMRCIQTYQINHIFSGHHQLYVATSLIDNIEIELSKLKAKGILQYGAGTFDFEEYQVYL